MDAYKAAYNMFRDAFKRLRKAVGENEITAFEYSASGKIDRLAARSAIGMMTRQARLLRSTGRCQSTLLPGELVDFIVDQQQFDRWLNRYRPDGQSLNNQEQAILLGLRAAKECLSNIYNSCPPESFERTGDDEKDRLLFRNADVKFMINALNKDPKIRDRIAYAKYQDPTFKKYLTAEILTTDRKVAPGLELLLKNNAEEFTNAFVMAAKEILVH